MTQMRANMSISHRSTPARFRPAVVLFTAIFGMSLLTQSGCYLASDGKNMERRVLQVEEQQAEFMSTFARIRDELTLLVTQAEEQVSALRETLEEARNLLGRSSANLGAQVDGLENRIKILQGRLDEEGFANEELQRALDTLRTDMEFRLEQLER